MSTAIRKIRQNIKKARAIRTQGVNNAQALYQRGVGDTNYVGAEVGDYLNNMNQKIGAGYDQAGQQMSAARASLQQQIGQTNNQNAAGANNEMARVGINGVGLGNFNTDAAFMKNLAAQQGTDEQNNNSFAKANAGSVGELLQGMNQGGRQSTLGQLLNARNDDITHTRQEFRSERRDALATINNILAEQAAAKARAAAYHRSGGGYSRGGYSSYGGSSGGNSKYDNNVSGSLALIQALGGGGKPKAKRPKKTNWVNDTMGFLFGG